MSSRDEFHWSHIWRQVPGRNRREKRAAARDAQRQFVRSLRRSKQTGRV